MVGSAPIVSENGLRLMPTAYATRISSGAVSPITRARPSTTPVAMPLNAVGRTTLRIVFHFGTPSAYEASRRLSGTSLSISSVERSTIGSISSTRASETANRRPAEAEDGDEQRVDEQRGDDGGDAAEDVDGEADCRGRPWCRGRTRSGRSRPGCRAAPRSTRRSAPICQRADDGVVGAAALAPRGDARAGSAATRWRSSTSWRPLLITVTSTQTSGMMAISDGQRDVDRRRGCS